jgi:aarF domain-containing kinase
LPANEAKKLQRQAEFQIPSRPAEPPTSGSSSEDSAELGIDQEKDVFYKPSANASPVLSSLPRVKVPKVTEDIQESDEHVQDAQINQDVYYPRLTTKQAVPEVQAIPGAK